MLLFLFLVYTRTIKKYRKTKSRKENRNDYDGPISRNDLVFWMKYKIVTDFVECQKIILKNETSKNSLYRITINNKLFKIIYLESQETTEIFYEQQENIESLEVLEL